MKNKLTVIAAVAGLVALGSAAVSTTASAFGLRSPQIPVLGGGLQGYLNSKGESINVLTDQQDAQVFTQSASGNALLTLMVSLTPGSPVQQVGIYNAGAPIPPLFFILSSATGPGSFSTMSFKPGNLLVVNRFDGAANFLSSTTFGGVDPNSFGFYLTTASGTFFSQDYRNPSSEAHMLAYQGTGINSGEWWLCWEDGGGAAMVGGPGASAASLSDQDYDDAVLILESVNPLATEPTSLGHVKAMFRR